MKYFINGEEGDFIQDTALIEYYKFNNMRHTVIGCMLGDFDVNGIYHIENEIAKELIEMPKYFVETVENIDIVSSELKLDKQISFMVTYQNDKVTLSLVEKLNYEANFKLNSGAYSNINEYVLDEVISSGAIDKNLIYDRWHIKMYGGQVVDVFNCDAEVLNKYFGIVNRFKYLLKSNRIMLEKQDEIENIEADYSMQIFEILKRYPKLEKEIHGMLAKSINEKQNFISIDKPYFAKTLNELLDKGIREHLDCLTVEEQEAFLAEYHNCLNEINIKRLENIDLKIKKVALEKNLEEYLVLFDAGEITEEDLLNLANSYVMVLKNGKLNPRFDLIWFLISIGVFEKSIGYEKYKEEMQVETVVVPQTKSVIGKEASKESSKGGDSGGGKDKKKDKKKNKKKDNNKGGSSGGGEGNSNKNKTKPTTKTNTPTTNSTLTLGVTKNLVDEARKKVENKKYIYRSRSSRSLLNKHKKQDTHVAVLDMQEEGYMSLTSSGIVVDSEKNLTLTNENETTLNV